MTEKPTVTIPLETAEIILRAFLPRNPNKLRLPHCTIEQRAAIRGACFDFRGVVAEARRDQDALLAQQAEKVGQDLVGEHLLSLANPED